MSKALGSKQLKTTTKIKLNKNELKWTTFEEVLKKASKSKVFKKAYDEELARLKLAKTIRESRLSRNLTQAAMAQKIDMPQSVIARLESGSHSVSVDTLSRIAHALGKQVQII